MSFEEKGRAKAKVGPVPEGMVLVAEGLVKQGDVGWALNDDGSGCWEAMAYYSFGEEVAGYWAIARVWVDGGAGI